MSEPTWDFGPVIWIDADAIGQPGQRTFRLRLRNEFLTATVWLEKEQLQMLGISVGQLLEQLPEHLARGAIDGELMPDAPVDFPDEPTAEMRAYRLALGYDEARDMLALIVHAIEESEEDEAEAAAAQAELEQLISGGVEESEAGEAAGEEGEETPPTLICHASRHQLQALSVKIARVVAAGRPRCPLCGAPINPGEPHICPRSNGHHKVDLSQL